jgi:hypothetical protein
VFALVPKDVLDREAEKRRGLNARETAPRAKGVFDVLLNLP